MSVTRIPMAAILDAAASRPEGYVDDVLSRASSVEDDIVTLSHEAYLALVSKYRHGSRATVVTDIPAAKQPAGPGSQLKALLALIGIKATPNCSCNAKAFQMDQWGPDECERRLPEILDWLQEESGRRKLPFVRIAAEQMVRLAIRRARKAAAH